MASVASRPASREFEIAVPKLRSDSGKPAELRMQRVAEWLETLPKINNVERGGHIRQALYTQNRARLSFANRLQLMHLYRRPLANIVSALEHGFEASTHPLSERNAQAAALSRDLLSEAAVAYKIVARDILTEAKIEARQAEFILALREAMEYLGGVLINAYISRLPVPPGTWRDVHQLYRIAEAKGFAKANGPLDAAAPSIADTYRRLLLLAAAEPYSLFDGECKRLYLLLEAMAEKARLGSRPAQSQPLCHFVVSLDSDVSPVPLCKVGNLQTDLNVRVLNTYRLVREVHGIVVELERGRPVNLPGGSTTVDPLDHDLLRRAGQAWGGTACRRRSRRTARSVDIALCSGIHAIHHFAAGAAMTDEHHDAPDLPATAGVEVEAVPLDETGAAMSPELPAADDDPGVRPQGATGGGDRPDTPATMAPAGDAGAADDTGHALQVCRVANESAAGLRLRVVSSPRLRFRVGDVLGLRYPGEVSWRAGVVRWLWETASGALEFGVHMLSPRVDAVMVRAADDSAGTQAEIPPCAALLLPENSTLHQPESRIVARATFRPGQPLELTGRNGTVDRVSPLRIVGRTATYDILILKPPPSAP